MNQLNLLRTIRDLADELLRLKSGPAENMRLNLADFLLEEDDVEYEIITLYDDEYVEELEDELETLRRQKQLLTEEVDKLLKKLTEAGVEKFKLQAEIEDLKKEIRRLKEDL